MVSETTLAQTAGLRGGARPAVFYKAVAINGRRGAAPTEGELELINRFARRSLSTDEVHVGECDLCNDRVDRAFERFTPEVLQDFAHSLPGKSLLAGHDHGSLPLGLWFDAHLRCDERGVTHLRPSFYMVKTRENEHHIAQLDGGVYRYASVGFRAQDLVCDICGKSWFGWECQHYPGQTYQVDGKRVTATAHYTRSDERPAEAVEGSIVYLGCQYDAELKAAMGQKSFGGIITPRARQLRMTETVGRYHYQRGRTMDEIREDGAAGIAADVEQEMTKGDGDAGSRQAASDAAHEAADEVRGQRGLSRQLADEIKAQVRQLLPQALPGALEGVKLSPRIVFPVSERAGNLSKADRQMVDLLVHGKAMTSTGAGAGDEWVPTELAQEIIDKVRLASKVRAMFPTIDMPSDTYRIPKITADPTVYFVSQENTAVEAASNPTTSYMELDAKKIMCEVDFSGELTEDSVVPLVPTLKQNIATALAEAEEDVILNGDTTAVQADNINRSANAYDVTRAVVGVRRTIYDGDAGYQVDASAGLLAGMRSLRAALGEYAVDPGKLVWIMSLKHYLSVLTDACFLTMEKLGEKATVLTGQLGVIDGIPVIMSSKLRDCDAEGIVQTDPQLNTKSQSLLAYRPGVYVGYRRRLKIETDRDVQKDMNLLVCSIRLAAAYAYGAGSLGYVRNA
jgi:HK97 family phage major capsid protein